MTIQSTHLVDDVMRHWPVTIRIFLDYKMRCVGCPIACFHTIDDACREHAADSAKFLADLQAAAALGKVAAAQDSAPETVKACWPTAP